MAKFPRIYYLIATLSQEELSYILEQNIPSVIKQYISLLARETPELDRMKLAEIHIIRNNRSISRSIRKQAYNIIVNLLFRRYFAADDLCLNHIPLLFLNGIYSGIRKHAAKALSFPEDSIDWKDDIIWQLLHPAWELLWYQAIPGEDMPKYVDKIIEKGHYMENTLRCTIYTKIIETIAFANPCVYHNKPSQNPITKYIDKIVNSVRYSNMIGNYILISRIAVYMSYTLFKYQYFLSLSQLLRKAANRFSLITDEIIQEISKAETECKKAIINSKAPAVIIGTIYPIILYGSVLYGTLSQDYVKEICNKLNEMLKYFNLDYVPGHQRIEFEIRYARWLFINGFFESYRDVIKSIEARVFQRNIGEFSIEYYVSTKFWEHLLEGDYHAASNIVKKIRKLRHKNIYKLVFLSYIYDVILNIEANKFRQAWASGDKCYQWARRHNKYLKIARLLRYITKWAHLKGTLGFWQKCFTMLSGYYMDAPSLMEIESTSLLLVWLYARSKAKTLKGVLTSLEPIIDVEAVEKMRENLFAWKVPREWLTFLD